MLSAVGTFRKAIGLLLLSTGLAGMSGCRSSPGLQYDSHGRLLVPSWYKLHFVLFYPDGRKYEGACSYPPAYDRLLAADLRTAMAIRKPGKVVRSIREVHGPRAEQFTPHGYGTMTYPGGSRKSGLWENGRYKGPQQRKKTSS